MSRYLHPCLPRKWPTQDIEKEWYLLILSFSQSLDFLKASFLWHPMSVVEMSDPAFIYTSVVQCYQGCPAVYCTPIITEISLYIVSFPGLGRTLIQFSALIHSKQIGIRSELCFPMQKYCPPSETGLDIELVIHYGITRISWVCAMELSNFLNWLTTLWTGLLIFLVC